MQSANDYDYVGGPLISYGNPTCISRCIFWNKNHVLAGDLLLLLERASDAEHTLVNRFAVFRKSCMECSNAVKHVFRSGAESLDHMRRGSQSGVMRTAAQARTLLAEICIPFNALRNFRTRVKELYKIFSDITRLTESIDQRARFYQEALAPLRRFAKVKKSQLRDLGKRLKDISNELHMIKVCIDEACKLDTLTEILVRLSAHDCMTAEKNADVMLSETYKVLANGGSID
jgi:hypothetical protein